MSKKSIKTGDIFKLGDHRLLCGDAANEKQIEKLTDKDNIDLVLTDPPYGVDYVKSKEGFNQVSKNKEIKNDHNQTEEEYSNFTQDWIEAVKPHLNRKNSFYIFNSDKMVFALRKGMIEAGCRFSQLLVWAKTHNVVARKDYLPQHELIAYGWLGVHEFKKSKDKSLIVHPKPNKSKLHPTMKPIGLLRRLTLNSSDIGDVVYDPFGGSGSTLIACEHTKRRCLTVEMDQQYCQTIIDRWEKISNLKAEKI